LRTNQSLQTMMYQGIQVFAVLLCTSLFTGGPLCGGAHAESATAGRPDLLVAVPSASPFPQPSSPLLPQSIPEGQDESESMHIAGIGVEGTDRVQEVLFVMAIHKGSTVTRQQIVEDLQRIYGLGYFYDVNAGKESLPDGVRLIVRVVENPTLQRIEITGNTKVATAAIEDLFRPQYGTTANYNDIRRALETIKKMYDEQGFSLARVTDSKLDPNGTLRISLNEGIIGTFRVEGNKETKERIIMREVTQKPGEVFDSKRMGADMRRIFNLNYFENIDLRFDTTRDPAKERVDIIIDLKEKSTGNVNVGAGYNSQDKLVGTFSIKKDNLFGIGESMNFDLQFGLSGLLLFRIDWSDPWIGPDRQSLGISAFNTRVNQFFAIPAYLESRKGFEITLGRPLFGDPVTTPWRGALSYRFEYVSILDSVDFVTPHPELTLSHRDGAFDRNAGIGAALSYDTRDVITDPRTGWFGHGVIEPKGWILGGDVNFTRLSLDLRKYIPLPFFTLAFQGRTSLSKGLVPIYERFYSGGLNTIRGWPENGFFSGNHYAIGSIELRFPIFKPYLTGALFYDVGEFWDSAFDTGLLRSGFGPGVRINTPLGPLRLDYGFSLKMSPQLHFSIGQKF